MYKLISINLKKTFCFKHFNLYHGFFWRWVLNGHYMFTTLSMSQPVLIYMYTVMIQSRQNIVRKFQFSGGPFTLPWIRLPILNSVTCSPVSIHCSILNERWVKQKGSKCCRIKTQIEDFVAPAPQAAAVLIKHLVNFLNICESCRPTHYPLVSKANDPQTCK